MTDMFGKGVPESVALECQGYDGSTMFICNGPDGRLVSSDKSGCRRYLHVLDEAGPGRRRVDQMSRRA